MKRRPKIIVRMIHMEGPLKGQIQECEESSISIGRYKHCRVRFPRDLSIISRDHAVIERDGNRFELIDHSKNGVFVNGLQIKERTYLKDGDVLMFGDGGPKAAFLTEVAGEEEFQDGESAAGAEENRETVAPPAADKEVVAIPRMKEERVSAPDEKREIAPQPASRDRNPEHREEAPIPKLNMSVVIRYGPTFKSSKTLPALIGRSPQCDMALDHPNLLDRHIQLFFAKEQYWVKDLTGQSLVSLNGKPIHDQAPLNKEDCLDLTPRGPRFRFLGEGRFFELPAAEAPPPEGRPSESPVPAPPEAKPPQKGSVLRNLFRR